MLYGVLKSLPPQQYPTDIGIVIKREIWIDCSSVYSNDYSNRDGNTIGGIYQNAMRSTFNNRMDRAVLAKNKAFVALMGIRPQSNPGDLVDMSESEIDALREEALALLRNFDESAWSDQSRPNNALEDLAFLFDHQDELYDLQYRSRELMCYLEAYDMLRPIGGARVWEEDIARRLIKFASNIYFLADFFGSFYAFNNHRIISGSALGMAGILFGDWGADNSDFGDRDARSYMPLAWVGYGMININTVLFNYQVFSDGGYNEGPHYLRYGFVYALPFFKAMKTFGEVYQISDAGQPDGDWVEDYTTNPGSAYSIRSPWFGRVSDAQPDLRDILIWISRIRQPEGRVPGIADTFNDTYFPETSIIGGYFFWPLASYEPDISDLEILNWSLSTYSDSRVDFIAAGNLPRESTPTWKKLQVFPQTGDIVFRSGWGINDIYLHVYAKDYSYSSTDFHREPHLQDDNSSFLLSYNKQVLALDGGFISWTDKELVADPTHHNLILVTGEGPDRNSTHAQIEEYREGEFYNYARIRTNYESTTIRRGFLFCDHKYFIIKDRINGQNTERYQLAIHGNDTNPLNESNGVIWQKEDAVLQAFVTTNNGKDYLDYVFSDQIHDNGYGMGRTESHRALSVGRTAMNMQYLSILFPYNSNIPTQPEIVDITDPNFAAVFVDRTSDSDFGNRYEFIMSQWSNSNSLTIPQNDYGTNNRTINDIFTDANFLSLSFDPQDPDDPNKINYFIENMTTLNYGNYVLYPQFAPKISLIDDLIMNEMDTLEITISATDTNGHYLSFSISSEILPSFINLIDHGNGTGIIQLLPGYLDAGFYSDIAVSVWDSGTPQMADQTTFNLTVENVNLPPIAIASSTIQSGTPPMDVDFSGQASTDLDGTIQSYQWNLDDGNILTTRDVSHTYDTAGKFYVILTVTDSDGATDSDTLILINTPDLSNLYISEVSYAEAPMGEFLEIYNKAPYAIKLSEFKLIKLIPQGDVQYIFDFGREEQQTETTTIVPANQFIVIGKDVAKNTFAEYWDLASENIFYNSGSDELVSAYAGNRWQLRYFDGTVNQNNGTLIDDTEQLVAGFQYRSFQNADGSWIHNISYTDATPGYMDNDQSLAVELMSFATVPTENSISLKWETGSEINNLGFYILRSISKDGFYEMIASYQTDFDLKGQGNSPSEKKYQFTDQNVEHNVTYWYKLVDVDFSGVETHHGPILGKIAYIAENLFQVDYGVIPQHFMLHDNYPNPFNMTTSIHIDIPDNDFNNEIININIYNLLGKKVSELYRGPLSPGKYRLHWDGKNHSGNDMASGLYILSFQSQSYFSSKKMILLR
jgi:PKD repeat protein